jgi:hypothetical protein
VITALEIAIAVFLIPFIVSGVILAIIAWLERKD